MRTERHVRGVRGSDGRGGECLPRSLRFFYFANQCPHNGYLLARIKTIAWKEAVPLHLYDVDEDERTCAEYRIFSPQMLLVNERYRIHGPFTREKVVALLEDDGLPPERYQVREGGEVVRGELVPITPGTALSTCDTCTKDSDKGMCRGKAEWVDGTMRRTGLPHLGYLHMLDGRCVGGAEFLPSKSVPYPISDKRNGDAFLTCVFMSDERRDYKTHPLERLLGELGSLGFGSVSVAASTDVVFPNGPSSWFIGKGFEDRGVLVTEEMHGAEVHLLRKEL